MSVTVFTEEELEDLEHKWTLPRFVFFPAGLVTMWSIAHPWPIDHWSVVLGWQLCTAYIMFCWTSCFHETAHQTLTGSQRVSIWLGRLLGCLIGAPYTVYRESHIRHHAYLNKPSDWELWPYSDPNASPAFRRVFVWLDLILGAITSPYIYGRIFFHRDSPIKSPQVRRRIRIEYAAVVVFWGTVLSAIAWSGAWLGFFKVWVIPHLLAGMYQNGRKLTEHLGMASYDPLLGTRTVIGDSWLTRICTYMNFDIFVHGPHHRHPRIAHDQLKAKMQEYLAENPDRQYPIFGSYWKATRQMIPWLFRNPGVGMNVGAARPDGERERHVRNFVADVTEEVLADPDSTEGAAGLRQSA